ncbi:hypothetical protein ACFO4L_11320 [Bacillus daqingensis]|uniref:Uncharacterized protein n=2 Tax=Bacillaceae TaxID=186817 RepID=A0A969PRH4_9BACI|nr:hypothetical protein [Alkalicoccus luteus]NJP39057.1 hypothetical protein [Alkalicoccus luteus]
MSVQAERKVTREEFMDLAQSGMVELFDLEQYKVVDGYKGETRSHFVYDTSTHDCFLVDLATAYDLVTGFYAKGDKQAVSASLKEIAASV